MLAELGLAQVNAQDQAVSWAQDLQGAYKQFPIRTPGACFCILMTILQHNALAFGSTGSVWCFNRAADGIMFLARHILSLPVCHYVDDFVGIKLVPAAETGFSQFTQMMRVLGLRMKESRALPTQKCWE